MKTIQKTTPNLFETYIPTIDEIEEVYDLYRDLPYIGMHERLVDEEA